MHSNNKGEYAKQKVVLRAVEKGYIVSLPTADARYDLILDDGKLQKVQVKYADGKSKNSANAVVVNLGTWDSKAARKKKHKTYTREEVDFILVYVPKADKIIKLGPELFEGKRSLTIRLEKPRNNQAKYNGIEQLQWI